MALQSLLLLFPLVYVVDQVLFLLAQLFPLESLEFQVVLLVQLVGHLVYLLPLEW